MHNGSKKKTKIRKDTRIKKCASYLLLIAKGGLLKHYSRSQIKISKKRGRKNSTTQVDTHHSYLQWRYFRIPFSSSERTARAMIWMHRWNFRILVTQIWVTRVKAWQLLKMTKIGSTCAQACWNKKVFLCS